MINSVLKIEENVMPETDRKTQGCLFKISKAHLKSKYDNQKNSLRVFEVAAD